MNSHVLGIIPARGGSKRIPEKNIRQLGDDPLIAHSIQQAAKASNIADTVVSTDDETISEVAKSHGGTVPFLRPPELARDDSGSAGVVTHALEWCEREWGTQYDAVVLLQPTSPLREAADIDQAIDRLLHSDALTVVSVSKYDAPLAWAVETEEDGYLAEMFDTGALWGDDPTQSQDLSEGRHPNGAIMASTTDSWRANESFYTKKTLGFEMPPIRSLDIDEPWELEVVRAVYRSQNE